MYSRKLLFDDESGNLTHFNSLEEYMALGIWTKL